MSPLTMRTLFATLLLLLPWHLPAQQIEIRGARVWTEPDQTRLMVDTAGAISHKVFSLDNPDRLVIDIPDARLTADLPIVDAGDPLLGGVRSGIRDGNDLRLVLDLKQAVRAKSFLLEPNDQYGHRLVVDLAPAGAQGGGDQEGKASEPARAAPSKLRDILIAVDAGHGGEDPGAIGPQGTREKQVTLAIARKLAAQLEKQRGMRAVLIRDGDYFLSLRKRIALARKHQADLFVSIHADAFQSNLVQGSSVYTLSHRGASSEAAKWLADKENSADLIGGIDLSESDDLLATVLLDMTQNATMEHSAVAGRKVLANLEKVGKVHKGRVQQAGFVVLKSPDIPSMLVETAFISNPEEEKRLRDPGHQERLAAAIASGIRGYFQAYPPLGTRLVSSGGSGRKHVISNGDTLSEIAHKYRVSLTSLRNANRIEDDSIRVGQVLTIPES